MRRVAGTGFVEAGKAEELLGRLLAHRDNHVFRLLAQLLAPTITLAAVRSTRVRGDGAWRGRVRRRVPQYAPSVEP